MANKRWAAGTIKIEGLDEVVRALEKRRVDVLAGVEAICHAGAEVVEGEIRGRAVGRLAAATMRETTSRTPRAVTVSVGVQKRLNYIARFQEFGVKGHAISARKLRGKKRGRKAMVVPGYGIFRSVRHPGHGRRAFIRPGFEAGKGEATRAMGKKVKMVVRG